MQCTSVRHMHVQTCTLLACAHKRELDSIRVWGMGWQCIAIEPAHTNEGAIVFELGALGGSVIAVGPGHTSGGAIALELGGIGGECYSSRAWAYKRRRDSIKA